MDTLSMQIASRRFDTVKRGYDQRTVDTYLSKLGDQVATLEDALRAARSHVETLEHRTRDVRDADTVVKTAFLAAAEAKAKLIEEGRAKAAEIIAEAEKSAVMIRAAGESSDEAESMLREARLRVEESQRDAVIRREEAEREAAAIISAAKARVSAADSPYSGSGSAAAADELESLVATLGALKEAAREGLEQTASLEADIAAAVGESAAQAGSPRT